MRLALAILLLVLVGCSPRPTRSDRSAPPIPLIAVAEDVRPFFMRQTLTIVARGETRTLDAVVQLDDAHVMTSAFLSAAGRPVVTMVQRDAKADISGPGVAHIPFDLRYVMQEIGLALLLSPIQIPDLEGPQRRASPLGEVDEVWTNGRIVRRSATAVGTVVTYTWADGPCPDEMVVANDDRDYRLTVTTTQCKVGP